jgi:hypothetical protein
MKDGSMKLFASKNESLLQTIFYLVDSNQMNLHYPNDESLMMIDSLGKPLQSVVD